MGDYEPEDLYSEPSSDEQDFEASMIAAFHQGKAAKGKQKGFWATKSKGKGQEKSAKVKKITMIKPANNDEGSSGYGGRGSGNGGGSAGGGGGGAITA
jgi:hypothetical protein